MTITVTISHNTPGKVIRVQRNPSDLNHKEYAQKVGFVAAGQPQMFTVWKESELILSEVEDTPA